MNLKNKEVRSLKDYLDKIDHREYYLTDELKADPDLKSALIKIGLID